MNWSNFFFFFLSWAMKTMEEHLAPRIANAYVNSEWMRNKFYLYNWNSKTKENQNIEQEEETSYLRWFFFCIFFIWMKKKNAFEWMNVGRTDDRYVRCVDYLLFFWESSSFSDIKWFAHFRSASPFFFLYTMTLSSIEMEYKNDDQNRSNYVHMRAGTQ